MQWSEVCVTEKMDTQNIEVDRCTQTSAKILITHRSCPGALKRKACLGE